MKYCDLCTADTRFQYTAKIPIWNAITAVALLGRLPLPEAANLKWIVTFCILSL